MKCKITLRNRLDLWMWKNKLPYLHICNDCISLNVFRGNPCMRYRMRARLQLGFF